MLQGQPADDAGRGSFHRASCAMHHWNRIIVVMPTTQATRARLRIGRCYSGQVLEVGVTPPGFWALGARHRLRVGRDGQGAGAAAQLLSTKPRDRNRPATPACRRGVVPCSQGRRRGTGTRGEQCRRASRPSRHVKCRRPAPPLPARPASPIRAPRDPARRRMQQRAIELVGIALGVAIIAAVALGTSSRTTSSGRWPPGSGCWPTTAHGSGPLQLHGVAPPLGDRRVGIGGRRWPSCSGPSATPPTPSTPSCSAAVPAGHRGLRPRARRPRWPGGRHRRGARGRIAGIVVGDRGLDFSLVWFPLELLVLTKARANPRWLWSPAAACAWLWVNTHGSILIGLIVLGVELVWSLVPEHLVARDRRHRAHPAHRRRWRWPCSAACWRRASRRTGPDSWSTTSASRRTARSRSTSTSGTRPISIRWLVLLAFLRPAGRPGGLRVDCAASRSSRARWPRVLFVEALRTQRLVDLPDGGRGGLAATLPARPRGTPRRGAGPARAWWSLGDRDPRGPVGAGRAASRRRCRYRPSTTSSTIRAGSSRSTPGATTRSPATGPPSSTGGPTSSRAAC